MKNMKMLTITFILLLLVVGCKDSSENNEATDDITADVNVSTDENATNEDTTVSNSTVDFDTMTIVNAKFTIDIPTVLKGLLDEDKLYGYSFEPNSIVFEYLTEAGDIFMEEISQNLEAPSLTEEQISEYFVQLMFIVRVGNGSTLEDYAEVTKYFENTKTLVEEDGYTYSLYYNDTFPMAILSDEEKVNIDLIIENMAFMEGDIVAPTSTSTGDLTFDTETLNGDAISNAIFSEYDLTMVNIWATWCGPCVSELPELGELYKELPENVNLIGIATDGSSDKETAIEMLQDFGCEYDNLLMDSALQSFVSANAQAIPTTIFVDSEGNIVGTSMIGVPANPKEDYMARIQELLDEMN